MQSIFTKYTGPTNTRGSRVAASTTSGQRLTIAYDAELSDEENAAQAALALACKLCWKGQWFAASTPDGFVFMRRESTPAFTL